MDDRDIEIQTLRDELALVTKERDELAAIVWGKIRGNEPVNTMGGQPAPQTACAMCGGSCEGMPQPMALGVRFCDDCVATNSGPAILAHARRVMETGGAAVVRAHNPAPQAPPVNETTDTQVVHRNAWAAWIDSLT